MMLGYAAIAGELALVVTIGILMLAGLWKQIPQSAYWWLGLLGFLGNLGIL